MEKKYLGGKETCKLLGVHMQTLYSWDKKGKIETIRTPGNKRLYNVTKFIKEYECNKKEKECKEKIDELEKKEGKINIAYVRVSTRGQINDLERQKEEVKKKYKNHIIIEDIGSGINLNRRGLRKIIKLGIMGKVNELVVVYKDRLTRYGYELIEDIISEYSNGKIIIINKKERQEPQEEIVMDVLEIMNVFVAKMNGMRKYNKKKDKNI
jgi:predicted site-specific integrase-resolvase